MKFSNKVLVVLLSIIMVLALAACDNTSTTSGGSGTAGGDLAMIVENSASAYTVVRAREGSKLESDLAVSLRGAIEDATGVALGIANDNMGDPTEYEILVGKTNRPESQEVYNSLKENEYVIKWVGKKLVIAGYDDLMISKAYDYFINNFVATATDTLGVPEGYENSYIIPTREEQLSQNALVAYTEYPLQVQRDFDYTVTVTQGDKTISIPVYNEVRQVNNYSGVDFGDQYRRFCEFAFSGDPVTVSVTVHQDMQSYLVAPSSKQYEATLEGNTVSFVVDEPGQIVFNINDDRNNFLAIFADQVEIEEEIPTSLADNIVYYGPGWHDVEGNVLKISAGYTLYVAPGAVLNARVKAEGDNVKIMGRGMIRDPYDERMHPDHNYATSIHDSESFVIQDVKIVDSRAFNLVLYGAANGEVNNVKILSNQISTDGISTFSVCHDITVKNCYLHVTDNMFVFGTSNDVGLYNFSVTDCVVGADYALFYPQGSVGENVIFKDIDVFRIGSFLKNTQLPSEKYPNPVINNLVFENIRVIDASNKPIFIYLNHQGNSKKEFTFKNIAIETVTDDMAFRAYNGGNYIFHFDNVWIGDTLLQDLSIMDVYDNLPSPVYDFKSTNDADAAWAGKRAEKSTSYTAVKIKIGDHLLGGLSYPAYEENGTVYVAIGDLLEELGYEVEVKDGTISYGSDTATVEMKNGVAVAPISFLADNNITTVSYDASSKTVNVTAVDRGENLLTNPGYEEGYTPEWVTFNFTPDELSEDAHSGSYSMYVPYHEDSTGASGISQYFTETLYKYGTGTYRLEAWAKLDPSSTTTDVYFGFIPSSYQILGEDYDIVTLTNSWQKITYEFTVNDLADYKRIHAAIGSAPSQMTYFYVDDWSLTKIS